VKSCGGKFDSIVLPEAMRWPKLKSEGNIRRAGTSIQNTKSGSRQRDAHPEIRFSDRI
jgi:hypothetical protein